MSTNDRESTVRTSGSGFAATESMSTKDGTSWDQWTQAELGGTGHCQPL